MTSPSLRARLSSVRAFVHGINDKRPQRAREPNGKDSGGQGRMCKVPEAHGRPLGGHEPPCQDEPGVCTRLVPLLVRVPRLLSRPLLRGRSAPGAPPRSMHRPARSVSPRDHSLPRELKAEVRLFRRNYHLRATRARHILEPDAAHIFQHARRDAARVCVLPANIDVMTYMYVPINRYY